MAATFAGADAQVAGRTEMPERKGLVAGNWKMNGRRADGIALARAIAERAKEPHARDLLVCPPATLLAAVGEARAEREAGIAIAVVAAQLAGSVPDGAAADKLVVAYEPVWAIGTGLTPTNTDITEMHAAIRSHIPARTRILYGGSVNPKNAAEILALPEVDGALVGGASLKAEDFWAIVMAAA